MVFSTIIFLCAFLPLTIIGYYLMPKQGKNIFLLLCSLFFYAWGEPAYVFVMLGSIMCNYILGMAIGSFERKRKLWLILAIVLNLAVLGVFKYSGFVMQNLIRIFPGMVSLPEIALPIGISFYTFQGLSYCIDVYRDKKIVQKNPINLALYIAMFPQLIAGPIVRYGDISPSLAKREHSPKLFAAGAERFIVGLSKKAVLANSMGALADQIMGSNVSYMSVPVAWIGAFAYTLQIYFDFSGYSDMAIGLGKIFGFHFMENFHYPYVSKSVREFWRRWHISLSTWFRDYLYIPMGGSRRGNVYFHLFVVFLCTGLWHGADWGFIIWGLWHGLFLIAERWIGKQKTSLDLKEGLQEKKKGAFVTLLSAAASHIYTMLVVIVGWVLFKLVDVRATFAYLKVMFGMADNEFVAYDPVYYLDNRTITLFIIALLACIPWKQVLTLGKQEAVLRGLKKSLPFVFVKRLWLLILLAVCFVFIITSTYNPFIYFRF